MVEERNRLQNAEPAEEKEVSTLRIVVGFVLTIVVTLLLIPFLFLGACMGIFSGGIGGWLIVGFMFLFLVVLLAVKTRNPGVRWGIILVLSMAIFLTVYLFTK